MLILDHYSLADMKGQYIANKVLVDLKRFLVS
jgi:hypothetical protein